MANYAIIRLQKRKAGAVTKLGNHHERQKNEYKSNPHIDLSRTHLNYHIQEPVGKGSYYRMVNDRIAEAGARKRSDSVVMQDCFVGATPEWIRAKSREEQEEYFRYAYDFFVQHYRKENILSAVVHMDEETPHMHLCFVPITPEGRLSSKEIIGGPKGLRRLQDEFYEYMHSRYPDLSRGTPARVTHRRHIPPYMFRVAAQLYEHYEEICKAINDIGVINSAKKKDAAISLLGRYAPEMVQLTKQLESTDKHIAYLERELYAERDQNSGYRSKNYEQELALKEANRSLYELNRRQRELEQLVSRIPPEVLQQMNEAERQARKKRNKGWER